MIGTLDAIRMTTVAMWEWMAEHWPWLVCGWLIGATFLGLAIGQAIRTGQRGDERR